MAERCTTITTINVVSPTKLSCLSSVFLQLLRKMHMFSSEKGRNVPAKSMWSMNWLMLYMSYKFLCIYIFYACTLYIQLLYQSLVKSICHDDPNLIDSNRSNKFIMVCFVNFCHQIDLTSLSNHLTNFCHQTHGIVKSSKAFRLVTKLRLNSQNLDINPKTIENFIMEVNMLNNSDKSFTAVEGK